MRFTVCLSFFVLIVLSFVPFQAKAQQMLERCDREAILSDLQVHPTAAIMKGRAQNAAPFVAKILETNGWTPTVMSKGLMIVATATYPGGQTRTLNIGYMLPDHIRVDTQTAIGEVTVLLDGVQAERIINGVATRIPEDTAEADMEYLPFLSSLSKGMAGTSFSLLSQPVGQGHAGSELRVYRAPSLQGNQRMGLRDGRVQETRYFIDPTTYQTTEIRSCRPSASNQNAFTLVDRKFSGYTTSNGFTYPTTVSEYNGSTLARTLSIDSVSLTPNFPAGYWQFTAGVAQ